MSLKEFMIGLATNEDVKRHYADDPQATMVAAGLTAEEQAAFSSGDSSKVRAALGKPDNDCMSQTGEVIPRGSVITFAGGAVKTVTNDSMLLSMKACLTEPLQLLVKKAKKRAVTRKATASKRKAAGGKKAKR